MPRVLGTRTIEMPTAPTGIERDADRMAMWRATYERKAMTKPRQAIAVSGCGEQAEYACWALTGRERIGRGLRTVYYGSSCNEEHADAPK